MGNIEDVTIGKVNLDVLRYHNEFDDAVKAWPEDTESMLLSNVTSLGLSWDVTMHLILELITEKERRMFVVECAELVMPIYEKLTKKVDTSQRGVRSAKPRRYIEAAKSFALGKIKELLPHTNNFGARGGAVMWAGEAAFRTNDEHSIVAVFATINAGAWAVAFDTVGELSRYFHMKVKDAKEGHRQRCLRLLVDSMTGKVWDFVGDAEITFGMPCKKCKQAVMFDGNSKIGTQKTCKCGAVSTLACERIGE